MDSSIIIYINKDAKNLNSLLLNEKWKFEEVYDRIYSISVKDKKIPWLLKTYKDTKYAKRESKNLEILKNIKGVPKVLTVGLSNYLNYIILSQAEGEDLFEHVKKNGSFSQEETKNITKQLLTIIKNIHDKKIIHNDIKPENIIYDKQTQTVCLIDFEEKYTQDYQSPERLNGKKITSKTDLWSLGVTIYFLLDGKVPFKNDMEILKKKIVFRKHWDTDLIDFLGCLLERDIILRYNSEEALNHVWIENN